MTSKDRYVNIQEWMLELDLRPIELLAFALIYGFSQDGRSRYRGGLKYMMHWLGTSSKHTALDTLESLEKKGLIKRHESKVRGCIVEVEYSVNMAALTGAKTAPNNKERNKDIEIKESNKEKNGGKAPVKWIN